MNILTTNFLTNHNKIYFSGIQNQNSSSLQKNERKQEQLVQLDALTARVYYKTINTSVNFGQKSGKEPIETLREKILKNYETGGHIIDFCKEYGICTATYYKILAEYHIDPKKRTQEKQSILDKEIIENRQNGGEIRKFCKRKGISTDVYHSRLRKYNLGMKQKILEKQAALCKEIAENDKLGGDIQTFCKEKGISKTTYYHYLKELHIDIKQSKARRYEAIDKKIIENFKNKGSVEEFCKEKDISQTFYYERVKKLQLIKKEQDALNAQIKEHYERKGNIDEFCKQKGITRNTYYKRVEKLGINTDKSRKTRMKFSDVEREEQNEALRKNFEEGGSIKDFCQKKGISLATYRFRLKKLGLPTRKAENPAKILKKQNLDDAIRENQEKKGDVKKFCQERNISETTYYRHLKELNEN